MFVDYKLKSKKKKKIVTTLHLFYTLIKLLDFKHLS